jgi:hypothetical protein
VNNIGIFNRDVRGTDKCLFEAALPIQYTKLTHKLKDVMLSGDFSSLIKIFPR